MENHHSRTVSLADVLPGAATTELYQSLVLRQLAPMNRGQLLLTLPDKTQCRFGSPDGEVRAQIHVRNSDFFRKCVLWGDIGFGESYVDGDWDTDDLMKVISWFLLNIENAPTLSGTRRGKSFINFFRLANRFAHLLRPNTLRGSRDNISEHYDLSNEFFSLFLDAGMTYSAAYFARPEMTLGEAQSEKYDRLCRMLNVGPADHLLEIGTGWGGFALHAAGKYGCRVTTTTISEQQYRLAVERVAREGLADRINVLLTDYRELSGTYDKIVSIEMLEAVGHRYMETFFRKCHDLLYRDGAMAIQVIVCPDARYDALRKNVDWIQKHIFPGSLLPSIARINHAVNRSGDMSLRDLKDLGPDYARTLHCWKETFNRKVGSIRQLGYDEKFIRKWNYYLGYCEAAFRMRNISVVQMIYTRPNNRRI